MKTWFIMLAISAFIIISFGDCDNTGIADEQTIYVFTPEMDDRLHQLKETSMDIILRECNQYYMDFYYCSLSRMYDMNNVIRHYESFAIDMDEKTRTAHEISFDFEVLNNLMFKYKRETDFKEFAYYTFDFEAVLAEYEFYLTGKEVDVK